MCVRKIVRFVILFIVATTMCSCTFRGEDVKAKVEETTPTNPTELVAVSPTPPPVTTDWGEDENGIYYIERNNRVYGWKDINEKTYYFNEDGYMHTGWLEKTDKKYYFNEDGSMAKAIVTIDGKDYHFASNGEYVIVVNPWNYIPDDYDTNLVRLSSAIGTTGSQGNAVCVEDLEEMIMDANQYSGAKVYVVSSYRNYNTQKSNFNNKVKYYQSRGYSYDDAYKTAATIIAIPNTSEHQLGLAFDIIDTRDWSLEERQENYAGQQWLMENCWKYGFILRYPKDTIDVTGIIYEPWHYRYVGKFVAKEIHDTGLTLEEYFASLS